jgi:hypothetical protein
MWSLTGLLLLAAAPGFAGQTERSLPLFFLPNPGSFDPAIRYVVETPELRAGFSVKGATFLIHQQQVSVSFPGASPTVVLEAAEPQAGHANFFFGADASQWKTGVPTYRKILYRGLYRGIDLTYAGAACMSRAAIA